MTDTSLHRLHFVEVVATVTVRKVLKGLAKGSPVSHRHRRQEIVRVSGRVATQGAVRLL